MAVKIVSSTTVKPRHMKILLWGNTGTRKTESILRYFPDILLIDTEGNAEQCTEMPEIPEFLYARTKDLDEVIETIDLVAQGKIVFPNGRPVLTLALDSATVLWTIRKDTRSLIAEERSARYNRSAEEATFTQLDWTMAKRPLVRLNTRLANCPVKYVIFTAREQDAYENPDKSKPDKVAKVGVKPESIKGLEYEMNLVLHLRFPEKTPGVRGPWECEVTKVQGALGKDLPVAKVLKTFPSETILAYTGHLTGQAGTDQDEGELEQKQASREAPKANANAARLEASAHSQLAHEVMNGKEPVSDESPELDAVIFWARAAEIGYRKPDQSTDMESVRVILKAKGYSGILPSKIPEMLGVLKAEWDKAHPAVPEGTVETTDPQPAEHPDAGKTRTNGRKH